MHTREEAVQIAMENIQEVLKDLNNIDYEWALEMIRKDVTVMRDQIRQESLNEQATH